MHYRLSRYFMNVAFACIAMVQWIVSLSTVFQSFFFFSSVVITINLLFLVPWMIISYIYQNLTLCLQFKNPSLVHIKPKRYKISTTNHVPNTGHSKRAMKRRRLSFSPILSPSRKLSRSSGTEPTIKIPTSSHEQQSFYDHEPVTPEDLDFPQKYYSLFNSGFDLGIVPSYTKLTRPDETEMIHEHSVLKFLNQVDNEDVVFFSRHLDINYS